MSAHGDEGAITSSQCSLKGGHNPVIGDVIDVPTLRPQGYALQRTGSSTRASLGPRSLRETRTTSQSTPHATFGWTLLRRKTTGFIRITLQASSRGRLYLIRPKDLRLYVGWDSYQGEPPKHKRRAHLQYNGQIYDLALTDPSIEKKYCNSYPPSPGVRFVALKRPADCILCISLTRPYQFTGCHHKVVATVIE